MSAARRDIRFALYSEQDFESVATVRRILEPLMSAPLGLRPTHYGHTEATERITDLEVIAHAVAGSVRPNTQAQRLGGVLLRSGQGCRYQLQWAKMNTPSFALFFGSLEREPLQSLQPRIAAILDLLRNLVPVMVAVYGEVRDMSAPHSEIPVNLLQRLPDIPAVSIYGLPYVRMFGEENLLTAPFHRVERLTGGQYWLEAGKSILEPVPEDTKAAIRSHLGEDAFMSGGKRLYRTGRAPQFNTSALHP